MNEDHFQLGIKAAIRNSQGKILILKTNPKHIHYTVAHEWDLPGGRLQKGATVEETLKREVKEELGLNDIKIVELLDASIGKLRFPHDEGLILFTYLCEIENHDQIALADDENIQFKWADPKEAANLLNVKFSDGLVGKVRNL